LGWLNFEIGLSSHFIHKIVANLRWEGIKGVVTMRVVRYHFDEYNQF